MISKEVASVDYISECGDEAFIAGVLFAQKWIDVHDELPEPHDGEDSVMCLVKTTNNRTIICEFNKFYHCWDDEDGDDFFSKPVGDKVTHWRPIELV